jgi:hypothetical protein
VAQQNPAGPKRLDGPIGIPYETAAPLNGPQGRAATGEAAAPKCNGLGTVRCAVTAVLVLLAIRFCVPSDTGPRDRDRHIRAWPRFNLEEDGETRGMSAAPSIEDGSNHEGGPKT